MGAQWSQFFPPSPKFTESDVEPQDGKVFIVTGGASGIGLQLVKMLYRQNARVYIAGRSEEKAREAIRDIQRQVPSGSTRGGSLEFLLLKLDDLASIKASVETFKAKESKLDVLWNNAGVSQPPEGSLSPQNIELQLATNCLGPFLFTTLLLPLLKATAIQEARPSRVVWVSSQIVELSAPNGGIIMDEVRNPPKNVTRNYVNSKTGNWFLSAELARRDGSEGIASVAVNPGAAATKLFRHTPWLPYLAWPLMHKAELAALTELYAGLSPDVGAGRPTYVVPWGRVLDNMREDLVQATESGEGSPSRAEQFWNFCSEETCHYI